MDILETKDERYSKAFKETYIIINRLSEELYFKIPESLIKVLKNNMDYKYNISNINENNLLPETKAILSLIYRDFLCDNNTKEILFEQDKLELEKGYEKYNNIFKNKKLNNKKEKTKELVIVKEKWYNKFLGIIKRVLKKY